MDVITTTALSATTSVTYSSIPQTYKYLYLVCAFTSGGNITLDSFTDTSAANTFSNSWIISGLVGVSTWTTFQVSTGSSTAFGSSGTQTSNGISVSNFLAGNATSSRGAMVLRIDNANTTTTKIVSGSSQALVSSGAAATLCTQFNGFLGKNTGGIFPLTGFRVSFAASATGTLILYGGY
jgi:hypothetical protein